MKLFFSGMAKAVVFCVAFSGVVLGGVMALMVLLEGKAWLGVMAGVLFVLSLGMFLYLFKRGVFSRYLAGVVLGLSGVVCCWYFGMPHKRATDEEICADLGVCSGKVVSEEKCSTLEGKWRFIDGAWLCYMKWAVYQPE